MKIEWRVALCCWLCALAAHAQDAEERAALAARGPSPEVTAATVDRFGECYAAEGHPLSEVDRLLLREALSPLARVVTASLAEGQCADGGDDARCAAAVRKIPCGTFANLLRAPDAASAPAWAQGYARTLTDRIARCYAAETGAPLSAEDARAVDGLRGAVAGSLASRAGDEGCAVDENQLPACAFSLQSAPCDALAQKLGGDAAGAPGRLTEACARVLRCEADDGDADAAAP
ncbi:MAG: hypothetical protein U0324_20960 [Polyangiales bacterium]